MKLLLSIFLLINSATLPDFAADGDQPAVHKRVFRSASNSPVQETAAPLEPVAAIRRIIAPVLSVTEPIVEPPVPKSFTEDFIEGPPAESYEEIVEPVEVTTKSARESDADKAIGIAQSYFRRGLWESAAEWYLMALDWNPASSIAAEGFVMSAFHAGQYNYAYRVGDEISEKIPGVKAKVVKAANHEINLLLNNHQWEEAGEVLDHFPVEEQGFLSARKKLDGLRNQPALQKPEPVANPAQSAFLEDASQAYRMGNYPVSLWNLEQAESKGALDRDAQLLRGWNFYQTGRYSEAVGQFERLYQTQTDKKSARGLVVSLRKHGDHERLDRLAKQWGGILAAESKVADTAAFELRDINDVVSNE